MITYSAYPGDVSDAEWQFVPPYLCLPPEDAGQREHDLRDVFDALRWIVRSGSPWRYLPKDFPPWEAVYQQARRWIAAGCFEAILHDLRAVLRFAQGRDPEPTAVVLDSRTVQSTPESGKRAGYDGYKRKKGSKVHAAVDTLGNLPALHVTPADEQDRAQVGALAEAVQRATDESVELAYVDQGYTGERPAEVADVVDALARLPGEPRAYGEVFNVGNDEEITITGLAERVRDRTGGRSEIRYVPYSEAYAAGFEDMQRRVPDLRKIGGLIGFKPKRKLDDILTDVIGERVG